jgi:hypothetical protein
VSWLGRLVAGLQPRRSEFDPGSVHVGFVVDKLTLWQVLPRVLWFSPVSFVPPVLHYTEKRKKLMIFITGLHNKSQGCSASVASAAGPLKNVWYFPKEICCRLKLTNPIQNQSWSWFCDFLFLRMSYALVHFCTLTEGIIFSGVVLVPN